MTDFLAVTRNDSPACRHPFNTDPQQVRERKQVVLMTSVAVGCVAGAVFAVAAITQVLSSVDATARQFEWADVAKSAWLFLGVPVFTVLTSIGAAALTYAPFRPSLQGGPDRNKRGGPAELREQARLATHYQRPVAVEPDLEQQARTAVRECALAGGN